MNHLSFFFDSLSRALASIKMYSKITVCEIKAGNCCLQNMFSLAFCEGPSIYKNALFIKREVTISGYWPSSFLCFFCVFNKEIIVHTLLFTHYFRAGHSGLSRIRDLNKGAQRIRGVDAALTMMEGGRITEERRETKSILDHRFELFSFAND